MASNRKSIDELSTTSTIQTTDKLLIQQNGQAMAITGSAFITQLASNLDGHGGIKTLQKSGSSPSYDTYLITFSDNTTSTFQVPHGKDANITSVTASVSNTVGTPSVTASVSGSADAKALNFVFSNLKGNAGTPATVNASNTKTQYATSTSGTTPPLVWSDNIVTANSGEYLWTKITIVFDTSPSNPVVYYSVARQGADGADSTGGTSNIGTVTSVAGQAPDSSGAVSKAQLVNAGVLFTDSGVIKSVAGQSPDSSGAVSAEQLKTAGVLFNDTNVVTSVAGYGGAVTKSNLKTAGVLFSDSGVSSVMSRTGGITKDNLKTDGVLFSDSSEITSVNSMIDYITDSSSTGFLKSSGVAFDGSVVTSVLGDTGAVTKTKLSNNGVLFSDSKAITDLNTAVAALQAGGSSSSGPSGGSSVTSVLGNTGAVTKAQLSSGGVLFTDSSTITTLRSSINSKVSSVLGYNGTVTKDNLVSAGVVFSDSTALTDKVSSVLGNTGYVTKANLADKGVLFSDSDTITNLTNLANTTADTVSNSTVSTVLGNTGTVTKTQLATGGVLFSDSEAVTTMQTDIAGLKSASKVTSVLGNTGAVTKENLVSGGVLFTDSDLGITAASLGALTTADKTTTAITTSNYTSTTNNAKLPTLKIVKDYVTAYMNALYQEETWTFTKDDGTTVTRTILVKR